MKSVAVFCGSRYGVSTIYNDCAERLGRVLAEREITMIYGGSDGGLMRTAADSVLAAGGKVVGVLPRDMAERGIAHPGLTDLHIVENLHERKMTMSRLAEGFAALPGGLGTLDEVVEILCWKQIQIHDKPVGLINIENYWDRLLHLLDFCADQGFLERSFSRMIHREPDPAALIEAMAKGAPPIC